MSMEPARATWTDERLDDLSGCVDRGFVELRTEMDVRFDRVDRDIRELRTGQEALHKEMSDGRDALRKEIKTGDESLRAEMTAQFADLERTIRWFEGTLLAGFLMAFLAGAF
jgi:hypothetical protein